MLPADVSVQQSRTLVAQLRRSDIFRDYEKAFREATGLPLALRPIEAFDLPHRGDPKENPFCALMAKSSRTCAGCLQVQHRLTSEARFEAKTVTCFAGLADSAVPLRVGATLIAFLQTGQVLTTAPRTAAFARAAGRLRQFGADTNRAQLAEAYFRTRVVTRKQYDSILRLLTIFAQHLSTVCNQLMVQGAATDAPAIAKAKALITERHTEQMSLTVIAQAVNMSSYYFCKQFRQATGLTFTDYVARVRVETVKSLLLDANKRVSEAAYEAGFQSLSQFNRVFRRVAGEAPTRYRDRLPGPGGERRRNGRAAVTGATAAGGAAGISPAALTTIKA